MRTRRLTVLQAEARAAAAAMKKTEKSNTSNEIIFLKSPEEVDDKLLP